MEKKKEGSTKKKTEKKSKQCRCAERGQRLVSKKRKTKEEKIKKHAGDDTVSP